MPPRSECCTSKLILSGGRWKVTDRLEVVAVGIDDETSIVVLVVVGDEGLGLRCP